MRNIKKISFILAVIQIISITALTSCRTLKITEARPIQIKAEFPNPYDDNGKPVVTLENDGFVRMPLWYWLKITEFAVDVETNRDLQEQMLDENIRN